MTFSKKNLLWGWLIFALALIVYVLTLEPTMSLWDCGEFMVSATKLEISHAPGAPLFMLIGRVFSLLSFGVPERQAVMVNLVSALSSAGTAMLLFWTSVWLMRKLATDKPWLVWLASGIGALSFAFTDSFWFSAVEAEVYAMSSLFMALALWAATRWDEEAGEPGANRWMLLIFFLTGLSIGVHLLNLLVIPSIALVVYFRTYQFSWKGIMLVVCGSMGLIFFITSVYIPGVFSLAGPLELFGVNSLHLPFNSGFYIYLVLLIAAFTSALLFTHRRDKKLLNLVVLCGLFLTLGYTSYLAVFIRSSANPPVDQGNPETTFELINYLKRENYGTRPILYGENFGSVARSYHDRISYVAEGDHYVPVKLNPEVEYESETIGFFPRMHSKDGNHQKAYAAWVDLKGRTVNYRNSQGQQEETTIPTFGESLQFFLRYQFVQMYWRYFMWNFAGKQDDVQGLGGPAHGNWESGIPFIDEARLGPQHNLPDERENNKGRNHYFFLPLILGLIGLFFHYKKDLKTFGALALLFAIMSVGLVVYLNEVPQTPRERDYVYVGSFYVFALWVGVGALATLVFLQQRLKNRLATGIGGAFLLAAGPGILLAQNYEDHDRSGRYTGRDLARNYLGSCEPNAILFTHADNDTYPLWYCQEVEGIRRDVRVVVMPYLNAGWYLRQINRKVYTNEGLHLAVPLAKYETGKVDYVPVISRIQTEQAMAKVLDFVANDSSQTKVELQSGERIDYVPLTKIRIPVGTDSLSVNLNKKYMQRNELAFWDIIASNAGERPVYFTSWADPQDFGLANNLRFDGMVYKLVAIEKSSESDTDMGRIDTAVLYDKLMNRCNWENLMDESVYFDWHHRRMFAVMNIRAAFYRLADALITEGDSTKAFEVIKKGEAILPFRLWPVDYWSCLANAQYFEIGQQEAGMKRLKEQARQLEQWIGYFSQFDQNQQSAIAEERNSKLYLYRELFQLAVRYDSETADRMIANFEHYLAVFSFDE
ncbi:glycosyltransferase family 117 protein [Mangrovibacterium lignilyticum]|uniref:glycosyltransferase family 117 protein n=1 Tax=Mangrovibacterium lignilyticum TaxID=2668052 RepID=UPI0013CF7E39|nr:DUF2723 domain-containing protein [Mangrovibacterium lignilyticum]